MKKNFDNYSDAYALYSDIVSGRDPDRKNASIFYIPAKWEDNHIIAEVYVVQWKPKV